MILHDGCVASRMEVCISLSVCMCVYSFGYLAQKVGGREKHAFENSFGGRFLRPYKAEKCSVLVLMSKDKHVVLEII